MLQMLYLVNTCQRLWILPEGKYIFKIIVRGLSGKVSLPQTISGESYGEIYQNSLPQRSIGSMTATSERITINWLSEEGCIGVQMKYVNKDGNMKEIFVSDKEETTYIDDFVPGGEFEIVSQYKPEINAYDIISSLPTKMKFPSF